MDEAEILLFQNLLDSLQELKDFLKCRKKESIEDLNILRVPAVAKKLGKNENDTRELMKKPDFPSVPDENGDLKVEEQVFIQWCRGQCVKKSEKNKEE